MSGNKLKDRKICLCVSGGIACFKAASLVSMLTKAGAEVSVAMTDNAAQFVTPLTFEALSHRAVVTDTFSRFTPHEIEHIAFAKRAEVMVVAPATANIIAKAAHGIADDFVSTTLLATTAPTLFVPAMNTAMYNNPIFKENVRLLRSYGKFVLDAGSRELACGDRGDGRMREPEEIFDEICALLEGRPQDFAGKNVLVTAGPTIERIDDVRYITNRSSGRMGYAIAEAARERGAEVTLVSGKTALEQPRCVKLVSVESAEQMYNAVKESFSAADVFISAAAVADYTPAQKIAGKLKKGADFSLELKRTRDILMEMGENKGDRIIVGFAAEACDVLENAVGKLERKHLDLIAANDISRSDIGFGGEDNALTLIFADGRRVNVEKCGKKEAAHALLDAVTEIFEEKT